MAEDPYLVWFRANLERPDKSQSGLARYLGIDAASVNRIVKGKRRLQSGEIAKSAEYFETAAPEIEIREFAGRLRTIFVVGTVEAGRYIEASDIDDYGIRTELVLPADERFPNARLMAYDVSGDSMNALRPRPIFPGDRAICVAYEDIAHEVPLRDGMVVVVQRSRDGGHLRERSIKQLEIYEDRLEFHPRSTSLRHKPIVVPRDLQADDGTTVEIVALLRRVQNDIPID